MQCGRGARGVSPGFGNLSGDNTMVTKQDDAFILRNLIALAAVETLGGAIALGLVFNLLT
ncbi:hypothetical protein Cmtc_39930 [Cupriavidus sp. TKC]|nr:hypothetical protein Cmtc_39930 [Cupriavidus sp. TKC]